MYERFYWLQKAPFHITPDPEFLFLSPTHREALASIIYGVEGRKGFIVIVGEVGLGKTTILRSYLEQVDKKRLRIIYIFNPNAPFSALLDTIEQAVGLDRRPDDEIAARVRRLHELLIEEYRRGRNVVLVVDEAQNMPVETLENLRLLSNLETSKDKLIQITLIGSPELDQLLDRHELRQLKQRTAVRSTLAPLNATESLAYIQYRLKKAGAMPSRVFTKRALRRIVKHAAGIPRTINILCDNALVAGFGYQKKPVTAAIAREVIVDLTGHRASRLWKWQVVVLATLLIIGGLFLANPELPQPLARLQFPAVALFSSAVSANPPRVPSPMPEVSASSLGPPDTARTAEAAAAPKQSTRAETKDPARAKNSVVATRVVKPGDNLSRLAAEVYGTSRPEVVSEVVGNNPGIKNPDLLPIGMRVRFPDIAAKRVGP